MAQAEAEAAPKLVRELGLLDATMIVMGSMIGSGIFITSAESARLVGSPGWLLVAWALSGLMTITGALCCAELAAMMPRAGGQYVFLREAYGRLFGFLFGWAHVPRRPDRHDRRGRGRLRQVPRRLRPPRSRPTTTSIGTPISLLRDALRASASRRSSSSAIVLIVGPDGHEHAGPQDGHADPEHVHVHQDRRAVRPDRGGPDAGDQPRKPPPGRRRGGTRRPTAGTRRRSSTA